MKDEEWDLDLIKVLGGTRVGYFDYPKFSRAMIEVCGLLGESFFVVEQSMAMMSFEAKVKVLWP